MNKFGKSKVLHQWEEPKEVSRYFSDVTIKLAKDATPRALLLSAAIIVPVYLFLRSIIPDDFVPRLNRGFIIVFVFGVLYCLTLFFLGVLRRFSRVRYKIDEKRIFKSDKIIHWKNVTAYSISEEEQFPDVVFIKVYTRRKRKMSLCLPKGELSEQVIKTFSERCSLIDESERASTGKIILTDLEYLYLLVLSFVYSIVAAYLVFLYRLYKFMHPLILLLIILALGPGTLGCLFLYGAKIVKEKSIKRYALIFNFFGFCLFFLCLVLFEFYRWSKILRDL